MAKSKEDSKKDMNRLKKGKTVEREVVEKSSSKKEKKSTTTKRQETQNKKSTSTKTVKPKSKKSQAEAKPKQKKKETKEKDRKIELEVKEETLKEVNDVSNNISLEKVVLEEKEVGQIGKQKAYFFPRILAYLIDIMIVTVLTTLAISVVPENKNYTAYLTEYQKLQSSFLEGSINQDEYINKTSEIVYDIDYNNVLPMIIEVVILILYFIVFQFYNKGQTIGKRLLKIRIVSENDEEVSMNQYILRSFIIPSVISKMLIIALVLFMGRTYYYYASFTVQGIQTVLIIVSIFMIMYSSSGRGLHDRVAKTKVIMAD